MQKQTQLTEEQKAKLEEIGGRIADIPEDVVLEYVNDTGDDDLSQIEEAYEGDYDSDVEFAQEMADNTGAIDNRSQLPWPMYCIDWEMAARDLMMDYTEYGGHYFRNF